MKLGLRVLLIALLLPTMAWANPPQRDLPPNPMDTDPAIRARVLAMGHELRCLVCQNQTLDASPSDFANDMRREIAEQMAKGLSDQEVKKYLTDRYGDYILYRPEVKSSTALLWYGPFVLMLVGGGVVALLALRSRKRANNTPLSTNEQQRITSLLHAKQEEKQG